MNNGQGEYELTAQTEIESIAEPVYQAVAEAESEEVIEVQ